MLDVKEIRAVAGTGGDGIVSFAHGLRGQGGGPDGGDGGRGGDVSIVAVADRWDLGHMYRRFKVEAGPGGRGSGNTGSGKRGKSVTIDVPLGTVAWWLRGEGDVEVLGEVVRPGDRLTLARGGEGGRGNCAFASPTNRAPVLAECGEAGDDRAIRLEVRLLADVAIVGAPNAGKSSLLAAVTRAKPRIGAFPFSTLEPSVGVAETGGRRLVLLDVPGMLEGAHEGRGLGLEFLRHATRAKVLLQVIDGTEEDLEGEFDRVDAELRAYGADANVAAKPRIVVINKGDVDGVMERFALHRASLEGRLPGAGWRVVSAESGFGLGELLSELAAVTPESRDDQAGGEVPPGEEAGVTAAAVSVAKEGDAFVVQCRRAERILAKVNVDDWRVRMQFHGELERLGVLRALEKAGVASGDTVRIGGRELEWE